MIRSAPSCLAARTPSRPTAPSPTTATVCPAGLGGDGGEPAGAEHVRGGQQRRDQVGVGHAGGRDEGAVGQRDPRVLGLGARDGTGSTVHAVRLVAGLADLAGVVGGEERADDEVADLDVPDVRADLLDDADVLWPIGWWSTASVPR